MLAIARSLPASLILLLACGGDNPAEPRPGDGADSTTVVLDASKDNTLIEHADVTHRPKLTIFCMRQ